MLLHSGLLNVRMVDTLIDYINKIWITYGMQMNGYYVWESVCWVNVCRYMNV